MSQETYIPTPAPCFPSRNPEDEASEEPIAFPSNDGSSQETVVMEAPRNTCTLLATQDEAAEQPNTTHSINGFPQQTVVMGTANNTCPSSPTPSTIYIPKITNGSSGHSKPDNPNGHLNQSRSPKQSASQTRLQTQASRASNESAETPSLPPGYEKDCCVHCTLALLFCQFLSLCNLLLDVLTCGSCSTGSSEFCCTCCSVEGCPDCSDSCGTDCGIVDACCESADCLEICMECCGLCFSN